MTVLLLATGLVAHFALLGLAMQLLLGGRSHRLRCWLLAPAIGVSAQVLAVGFINQAGVPVERFARWEMIIVSAISAIVVATKWRGMRGRLLTPFVVTGLLGIVLPGWPALIHGFHWLSYCNDDMANYCLAAIRHLDHGFFDLPTMADLEGRDYSQYFAFMHVAGLIRYGSEVLLAWVAGVTGLEPRVIFMPSILALAAGAPPTFAVLALESGLRYRTALVTTLLLAISPLAILGTVYQLIAQALGLLLLGAISSLLMTRRPPPDLRQAVGPAVLAGVVMAALMISYPELSPFAGLAFAGQAILAFWRDRATLHRRLALAGTALAISLMLLRYNVFVYLNTVIQQISSGSSGSEVGNLLFPYYLLPSGFANLFGFIPISRSAPPFLLNGAIILGIALLVMVGATSIRHALKRRAWGWIALVMLAMSVQLFVAESGFGLFKLAMFLQPCVAISLALAARRLGRFAPIGLALLVGAQAYSIQIYTVSSLGNGGSFVELPYASASNLSIDVPHGCTAVASDISNLVGAKYLAGELVGVKTTFFTRDMLGYVAGYRPLAGTALGGLIAALHPHWPEISALTAMSHHLHETLWREASVLGTKFERSRTLPSGQQNDLPLVQMPASATVFNRWGNPGFRPGMDYFKIVPPGRNRPLSLAFINSSEGIHHTAQGDRHNVAFYQNERDYFNPGGTFAGAGPFLLFAINGEPRSGVYVRISLTKSIMGEGRTQLPYSAKIRGASISHVPFTGGGAANVIVGPLQPLHLDGTNYIAVDFGELGRRFHTPRTGLMSLYHTEIYADARFLIGFLRDISVIDASGFTAIQRPRQILSFPYDLSRAATLEYSGWYEDGWISKDSWVKLAPALAGDSLEIRGHIPAVGTFAETGQDLAITINGVMERRHLPPGSFYLNLPLPKLDAGCTRVEMRFEHEMQLTSPDDRPVSAFIQYLGLHASS